ncbi:MAG TPA: hypothetical protein VF329_15110 [Gammaproteobacteria bacterium]
MAGSARHRAGTWHDAATLVAAFAGTSNGAKAVVPALRRLRAALPRAKLLLLWPAEVEPPPGACTLADRRIDYRSPEPPRSGRTGGPREGDLSDLTAASGLDAAIAALAAHSAYQAIVFTESGAAPYAAAYVCYLAGIPERVGLTAEFGGAVLSRAVPPPAGTAEHERHLFLLDALGFGGALHGRLDAPAPTAALGSS